jgi:hypothetical protein
MYRPGKGTVGEMVFVRGGRDKNRTGVNIVYAACSALLFAGHRSKKQQSQSHGEILTKFLCGCIICKQSVHSGQYNEVCY